MEQRTNGRATREESLINVKMDGRQCRAIIAAHQMLAQRDESERLIGAGFSTQIELAASVAA